MSAWPHRAKHEDGGCKRSLSQNMHLVRRSNFGKTRFAGGSAAA